MLQPREAVTTCPECKKRDARIARLERELAEVKDALVCASDRVEQLTIELNRLADEAAPRLGFAASVESGKAALRRIFIDGNLPPETPRRNLAVRDDEKPEKILDLAREGKVPRGWTLAVGKGPCIVCLEPTSGLHADSWRHYECSADVKVDPNYGTLGHNRPQGKVKVEKIRDGKVVESVVLPNVIVSRLDDAAEF